MDPFAPAVPRAHQRAQPHALPRVVIVGAGFAGLAAARALARAPVAVTVIDRRNYHLFQPLLYQVATAALSPSDIAWPIRRLLRGQANARVLLGRVAGIGRTRREVLLDDGESVGFDHLILATGARHAYFGHDGWEAHAPGLKKIDDATALRQRILGAFEMAEKTDDEEERRRLLTFVIVGGGPTGVEMAGAVAELARRSLAGDFRRIDPASARVILVEAGPRVLPSFSEHSSERAAAALAWLGVELRTGVAVTECGSWGVRIGTETVESATLVWAAGVMASAAAKWLGVEADRAGRVKVAPDLSVPGWEGVRAVGDTASVAGEGGRPVPGVAAAAKQMGRFAGEAVAAAVAGTKPRETVFRYRDPGAMATIGRNAAIAEIGRLRLSGFPAWVLWAVAHVWFLIGNRNRLAVMLSWMWTYLTHDRASRLITGTLAVPPGRNAPRERPAAAAE